MTRNHAPPEPGKRGPWAILMVRDYPGAISCKARLTALVLATYCNTASGQAWPHIGTLMAGSGLSRRSVQSALRELEQAGLVRLAKRGRYGKVFQFESGKPCRSETAESGKSCTSESGKPCRSEIIESGKICPQERQNLHPRAARDAPPIRTEKEPMKEQESVTALPARAKRKARANPYPRPDGVEPQVWRDFLANRARKKMSNTPTAHKRLLNDLARLADDEWPPGRLVEFAAARGWCGIYDPRGEVQGDGRLPRQPDNGGGGSLLDLWRAARAEEEAEAERDTPPGDPRVGPPLPAH